MTFRESCLPTARKTRTKADCQQVTRKSHHQEKVNHFLKNSFTHNVKRIKTNLICLLHLEDSSNKDEEAPVLVPESPTTPFKQSPTKSNVKPSPQELMGCAPATILVDLNWDDGITTKHELTLNLIKFSLIKFSLFRFPAQTEVSSLMSFDLGADLDDEVGLFMRDLHTVLQQL